jgi:ABC-type branched-subunit amino acid transport system ATPase component
MARVEKMSDPQETTGVGETPGDGGNGRPTVHVQNAVKSFHGRVVVEIADLTLGKHPIEGLIGPNGAGKTTLLRMIMHSISLDQGTIAFFPPGGPGSGGEFLSDLPSPAIARLGVVKTNQVIQDFDRLTILDSLMLSVAQQSDERLYEIYRESEVFDDHISEIRWYLDEFPFEDPYGYANSAGEKKLLDIIRCLLLHPKVLLLDEPAAGLPEDVSDQAMALIKEKASAENMSVVLVEHDLNVVWGMSDYVHFMAEGSVILQGEPAYIRQHDTVVEKYLGSGHV